MSEEEEDVHFNPGFIVESGKGKYVVDKLLGEGGFGAVYRVYEVSNSSQKYAMKVEKKIDNRKDSKLKTEIAILKLVANDRGENSHFTQIVDRAKKDTYYVLVMQLVGKSLNDLKLKRPEKVLSLGTGLGAAMQCLEACQDLHKYGFIHRDLKPANYACGLGVKKRNIYILDFGIARRFLNEKNELKGPLKKAKFKGTLKFASLACHRSHEMAAKDDCESWFYLLVDLIQPSGLPWKKLQNRDEVQRLKEECRNDRKDVLLEGIRCRTELWRIIEHIDSPKYYDHVDYGFIYEVLKVLLRSSGCEHIIPSLSQGSQMPKEQFKELLHCVTNHAMTIAHRRNAPTKSELRALARRLFSSHVEIRDAFIGRDRSHLFRCVENRRRTLAKHKETDIQPYKKKEIAKADAASLEELNNELQLMPDQDTRRMELLVKTRPYRMDLYKRSASCGELLAKFRDLSTNTDLVLCDFYHTKCRGKSIRDNFVSGWHGRWARRINSLFSLLIPTKKLSIPEPTSTFTECNRIGLATLWKLHALLVDRGRGKKNSDDMRFFWNYFPTIPTPEEVLLKLKDESIQQPSLVNHGPYNNRFFIVMEGRWIDAGETIGDGIISLVATYHVFNLTIPSKVHSLFNILELFMGITASTPLADSTDSLFASLNE